MTNSPHIVIAGASGYIGRAIIPKLLLKFPNASITALSRSEQDSDDPRVSWRACDLFSLKSLEHVIPEKVDLAFYLVHSMGPTAHFDQGSFADYDLLLADNFARIMRRAHVGQVIYLGGLIPQTKALSLHLRSRLEVEQTFREAGLPLTVFRAGLIIGDRGSSFQILTKLVRRLPVMICPRWTQTLTTPVGLGDVVRALVDTALDEARLGRIYDLAGCASLTYVEMMRETARAMGKRRWFLTVPLFTPTLSRLWVRLITGASKGLVYPLVASLEHPMVARTEHLYADGGRGKSYADLLHGLNFASGARSGANFRIKRRTVRSVQRLVLPPGRDAEWVKDQYLAWLPKRLAPFIKVSVDDRVVAFSLLANPAVLLQLTLNRERSDGDRQLLYITGGLLTADDNTGRLEFRVVLDRKFVIAAIHDFKPALPDFTYRRSQAVLHLIVMRLFGRHLARAATPRKAALNH